MEIKEDLEEKLTESSPLIYSSDTTKVKGNVTNSKSKSCRNLVTFSALWITYLVVSVAYSILAPFYPQEAAKFNVSSLMVGFIMGASPLCVTFMSPIFGYYIPQIGLKFMMIAGCFLVGGSFLLLGFLAKMSSYFEFVFFSILLRVVEGIGSAGYITASFTIATILFPSKTGTVIGMLELGSGIGFAIGPPLGGFLYKIGGFFLPFLVTGSTVLVFIVLFVLLVPDTKGMKQYVPPRTLLKFSMDVPFLLLILCHILVIASLGFFSPVMSLFLIDQFNLSEIYIGVIFFIGPAAYMLSSIVAGRLSDKLGPRYLIVGGLLLSGIAFFFIGPAPFILNKSHVWLTCTSMAAVGIGIGFGIVPIFSDMLQVTRRIDPSSTGDEMYGYLSGLSSAAYSCGEFLGPVIGGALAKIMSFQMSASIVGMFLLTEAILLLSVTFVDKFLPKMNKNIINDQ